MQITVPWFKIKIDNNFTGDIISLHLISMEFSLKK